MQPGEVAATGEDPSHVTYDRGLLLLGAKRNTVLSLPEVRQYGLDSHGDGNYVSLYGLPPSEWFARGVRLLGRTVVECTRDRLADAIGRDTAAVARMAPASTSLVVDPFVGSANTLYWMLRHLPGAKGLGFELDADVFAFTERNLSLVGFSIEIARRDYRVGLAQVAVAPHELLVVFIAPPWGDALHPPEGVDLRGTDPPVIDILDALSEAFSNLLLCVIQVYERNEPASLGEVQSRFDWSYSRSYDFNEPGANDGVILGTIGWKPEKDDALGRHSKGVQG
jgi:hypothetical protein